MNAHAINLARRHLSFGWYTLFCFALLGAGLELLHAVKQGYYLDVGSETRRLMWRLAHAHGALLGLVNVAFAHSVQAVRDGATPRLRLASGCLIVAGLLLPLGFFLGGVFATAGDPGLPILLVPVGALLLLTGLWATASSIRPRSG
jgi:hypothetical protein